MTDVTDATFQQAVLERSHHVTVVVDLWAEWCGPCKTIGPMLERAVAERPGQMELAKVDVDANPMTAQMFQVQSIPAVYALKDGKVIDGFVGAVPQDQIEAFLDRIGPSEVDDLVAIGDEASLRAALEIDPGHRAAIEQLCELLLERREPNEALELLARIPETPELHALAARARLIQADVDLATASITATLDDLLDRVASDDAARQEYLDLLEALGSNNPETATYRKALASRLF
jgi:putative thioredoxin